MKCLKVVFCTLFAVLIFSGNSFAGVKSLAVTVNQKDRTVTFFYPDEKNGVSVLLKTVPSSGVEGRTPFLKITPDGKFVYVVEGTKTGNIEIFDMKAMSFVKSLVLTSANIPVGIRKILFSTDGKTIIVSHHEGISLFDAATFAEKFLFTRKAMGVNSIQDIVLVDGSLYAATGEGKDLLLVNIAAGTFSKIAEADKKAILTLVAISPDKSTAFALHKNKNSFSVFDLKNKVSKKAVSFSGRHGNLISKGIVAEGNKIFIITDLTNALNVVAFKDSSYNQVDLSSDEIALGKKPYDIKLTAAGLGGANKNLLIPLRNSDEVVVVDTATNGIINETVTGKGPVSIDIQPPSGSPDIFLYDLMITKRYYAALGSAPQADTIVTLKNIGTGDVPPFKISWMSDAKIEKELTFGTLKPGQIVKVFARVTWGNKIITVSADRENKIAEADETNNSLSKKITMDGSTGIPVN